MNNGRRLHLAVAAAAVLLAAPPAQSFMPPIHEDISQESLETISRTVDGETLTFQDEAIEQIRDANAATDSILSGSFFDGPAHFTEESFAASSNRLRNLKQSIISKITASSPDGDSAREDLGTALHTLQDFYAHSNWVELGNAGINQTLGRSTLANPPAATAFCPNDEAVLAGAGLNDLTSVYYEDTLGCGPIPAGKCRHGTWLPPSSCTLRLCNGIAKDKPCLPNHAAARARARTATTDYVDQILDDPAVAGNAKAIKALMGIKGTLGFIIDDTGSMGPDINQVKSQVAQIVASVRGTDNEPDQYLLIRFGDPDVGSPLTTADPDVFLSAVNSLSPSGGGDCPELSMTAQIRAIAASLSDSTLFVFTDASAKDSGLSGAVSAAAQHKRIQVTFLLTGTCSPVDPGYERVAAETGGQLFLLSTSELAGAFDLIRPQLTGDFVTVLSIRDSLAGTGRSYDVPVDSAMSRTVFAISIGAGGMISVVRPSGVAVDPAADPDVTRTQLSAVTIFTVTDPEPGIWRLDLSGSGPLAVDVKGNSPLEFKSFDFVRLEETVHGAYFPIEGQPAAGELQSGLARLMGPFSIADFRLVDETGATLVPLAFALGDPDAAADEHVGAVELPAGAFRVAVSGFDTSGQPYQRVAPERYRGRTVVVNVDPATIPRSLAVGADTEVDFVVRNLGAAAVFSLLSVDDQGAVRSVTPTQVGLDPGAEATVTVVLRPPAGADGSDVSLTVTATAVGDPDATNSSSLVLPVVSNLAPDCSAAFGSEAELWPPNHKLVEVEILGVVDQDGDDVAIAVDSITQDEPVLGPGSGNTAPDGVEVGSPAAQLRAERAGGGNGRVYHVGFTADDGKGGLCQGTVTVSVPHSRNGDPAVDDGQLFDSTEE